MPPPDFVEVAKTTDVEPGQKTVVAVDDERYVLVNLGGEFAAILDECGHASGILSKGKLEGHVIVCPRHFARYDLRTGTLVDGPLADDVPVCEVLIEGDTVYLRAPHEDAQRSPNLRYR